MKGNIVGDIATHRKRLGWTQEELADKLGVNRKTIIGWEGGKPVGKRNKAKLCNLFGDNASTKGVIKPDISQDSDEEWYRTSIQSLIAQNGLFMEKFTSRTEDQIEDLKKDKGWLKDQVSALVDKVGVPNDSK